MCFHKEKGQYIGGGGIELIWVHHVEVYGIKREGGFDSSQSKRYYHHSPCSILNRAVKVLIGNVIEQLIITSEVEFRSLWNALKTNVAPIGFPKGLDVQTPWVQHVVH